jgi:GH35 family endo-1,4-beta-xylanase
MKKMLNLTSISLVVTLFLCGIATAQIPAGGIQMNAANGSTYQRIGKCTLSEISVSGQPFTKGLQITIGTDVNNFWDAQVQFPTTSGIAANDVVLVAFYARTLSSVQETGEGALTVVIENSSTYTKELSTRITIGNTWKQYFASAKCVSTLSTTQVRYAFQTGYPSQTIEIADVKFLNYRSTLTLGDLPITVITYSGQSGDAAWRASAADRINQIRKGKVDIIVQDQQGKVLKDANVSIEMIRHQFGFGSAIPASTFLSNGVFRNKVYELFNEVVFENDLKWPQFNPNSTQNLQKSLDSLDLHKITVRGHNVIWPSWKWCPSALQSLSSNPVALRAAIEKRIDEVTSFTKGRLIDWDVINEPYSEHDIMDVLGNEVMADWLKRVKTNDGNVKLYINDYGILSSGGLDVRKQDSYYNLIKYLDDHGAKVDGIGMQGHFSSDLTPITRVYSILERFASLGKEIKITEHDINITQRAVQADYTRDFMTILFSHPSVKSILIWGFWQGSHWKPDAALYNTDWTLRPHGEAWKDLVLNQWWTKKTEKMTDSQGKASFEGFLGTYRYIVKSGGRESLGTLKIANSKQSGLSNSVVLVVDNSTLGQSIPSENKEFFKVYPNPFQGYFVLETTKLGGEPMTAELFNTLGQKVLVRQLDNASAKLSITYQIPGFYTLRVGNHKEVKVVKLVGI